MEARIDPTNGSKIVIVMLAFVSMDIVRIIQFMEIEKVFQSSSTKRIFSKICTKCHISIVQTQTSCKCS